MIRSHLKDADTGNHQIYKALGNMNENISICSNDQHSICRCNMFKYIFKYILHLCLKVH